MEAAWRRRWPFADLSKRRHVWRKGGVVFPSGTCDRHAALRSRRRSLVSRPAPSRPWACSLGDCTRTIRIFPPPTAMYAFFVAEMPRRRSGLVVWCGFDLTPLLRPREIALHWHQVRP